MHRELAGDVSRLVASPLPQAKKAALRAERLDHLLSAVKFDKTDRRPRHELLDDAMNEDLVPESLYWAKEILKLEPDDPDAHFVLAVDALEGRTPDVPEARRHLKVLEDKKATLVRPIVDPREARRRNRRRDGPRRGLRAGREPCRSRPTAAAIERITWLRIITLQIRNETDLTQAGRRDRAGDARHRSKQLTDAHGLAPARVARLRTFLELTQRRLDRGLVQGRRRCESARTTARSKPSSSSSRPSSSLRSPESRNPTCKRS